MSQDQNKSSSDHDFGMAVLISGKIDGRNFWAYVSIDPEKYEEFMQLHQAGEHYILSDYGDVIEYGFDATEPPEHVMQKMEREYGFDHGYDKKIEKISHDLLSQLKPGSD